MNNTMKVKVKFIIVIIQLLNTHSDWSYGLGRLLARISLSAKVGSARQGKGI